MSTAFVENKTKYSKLVCCRIAVTCSNISECTLPRRTMCFNARPIRLREKAASFQVASHRKIVFDEYINTAGQQSFLDSIQNYEELMGIKPDLYKAFLPKAWAIQRSKGIIGLLHPEGVYDDARGGEFRKLIYRRLRGHFQFINQKKLFDIGNTRPYSINLYSDEHKPNFDAIFYLFDPHTIDEAYEIMNNPRTLFGIKDENGYWNEAGDRSRIIHIDQASLESFIGLLDEESDWQKVRMPMLFSREISKAIEAINRGDSTVFRADNKILYTEMLSWLKKTLRKPHCRREFLFLTVIGKCRFGLIVF